MFSIQLTTKNLDLTAELKNLAFEKLKKLEKRLSNYPPDAVVASVLFKKRVHHYSDSLFTTQISLNIPSASFHAHQEGYTLEESLVGAIEDIEDQLEKHRDKLSKTD